MMRRSDRPLADGFHLSTYLTEPGLPFLLSTWTRHDNNVSLWLKDGVDVRLVHYWELERHTGIKHHGFGTSGRDQARALLDRLLSTYGLSTADIGECWGTPGISASDVDASRFYADVALPFHSIAHLHSAAFLDGVPQDDRTVLGFAVDGAPDFDSDVRLLDNWLPGAFSARRVSSSSPSSRRVLCTTSRRAGTAWRRARSWHWPPRRPSMPTSPIC